VLKETSKVEGAESDEEVDNVEMSTKQIEYKKQYLVNQIENKQNKIRVLNKNINEITYHTETNSLKQLDEKYKKLSLKTIKTKEVSNIELNICLKQAENVDLCFLIDCTSSMSSYIEQVQEKINEIVSDLKSRFENFSLRLAFVGYRDYTEKSYDQLIIIDFLDDIETFRVLVSEIQAFGGGDECEDIFSGLNEVTKLEWSNESRILFHVCDAPCHGSRFHLGINILFLN